MFEASCHADMSRRSLAKMEAMRRWIVIKAEIDAPLICCTHFPWRACLSRRSRNEGGMSSSMTSCHCAGADLLRGGRFLLSDDLRQSAQ